MKILLLILAGIVAGLLPQNATAAALPDCQSSYSYQGVCMDTFGDSFGDPWHLANAMYCDVSGNFCSGKEPTGGFWSGMTEGYCFGDFCRHAGASYDPLLFGGYPTPMPGWVAPVIPPILSGSASAVDFSQLGEDVRYVGIGVIALALILIAFVLVKKHLDGTDHSGRERVPFNYRDAWPEEQAERQFQSDSERGLMNSGFNTGSSPEEHDARMDAVNDGLSFRPLGIEDAHRTGNMDEEMGQFDDKDLKAMYGEELDFSRNYSPEKSVDWAPMNMADAEHDAGNPGVKADDDVDDGKWEKMTLAEQVEYASMETNEEMAAFRKDIQGTTYDKGAAHTVAKIYDETHYGPGHEKRFPHLGE